MTGALDPADIVAIEQVVRASAHLNDRRDWHALAALYTADGVLTRPSGQRIHGRDAIEAAYAGSPTDRRTRHVCGGPMIESPAPGIAHVTTPVLLFTWRHADGEDLPPATGPAIGEFADVVERAGSRWLIRARVATLSARVPSPAD